MSRCNEEIGSKKQNIQHLKNICLICYRSVDKYITAPLPVFQKLVNSCSKYLHSAITKDPFTGVDKWDTNNNQEGQLPFCQQCFDTSFELSQLHDQLEKFQKDISDLTLTFSLKVLSFRNQARSQNTTTLGNNTNDEGKTKMEIDISGFHGQLLGLNEQNNFPAENTMLQVEMPFCDQFLWDSNVQENAETIEVGFDMPDGFYERTPVIDHFLNPYSIPENVMNCTRSNTETAEEEPHLPVPVPMKKRKPRIRKLKNPSVIATITANYINNEVKKMQLQQTKTNESAPLVNLTNAHAQEKEIPEIVHEKNLNGSAVAKLTDLSPKDVLFNVPLINTQCPKKNVTPSTPSSGVLTIEEKYNLKEVSLIIPILRTGKDGKFIVPAEVKKKIFPTKSTRKVDNSQEREQAYNNIESEGSIGNTVGSMSRNNNSSSGIEPLISVENLSKPLSGKSKMKPKLPKRRTMPATIVKQDINNIPVKDSSVSNPTADENKLATEPSPKGTYFTCRYCTKGFRYIQFLQYHERSHLQMNKQTFRCSMCTKHFNTRVALKQHMNIHSGKKPFKCKICAFTTAWRGSLKGHELTHAPIRYDCKCCSKSYTNLQSIRSHFKKEHSEKSFTLDDVSIFEIGEGQ